MGTCKYCGRSAGFFSHVHKECENKHSKGLIELEEFIKNYIADNNPTCDIDSSVKLIAREGYLTPTETEDCVTKGILHSSIGIDNPLEGLKKVVLILKQFNISCLNVKSKMLSRSTLYVESKMRDYLACKIESKELTDTLSFFEQEFAITKRDLAASITGCLKGYLRDANPSIDKVHEYERILCSDLYPSELRETLRPLICHLAEAYFDGKYSIDEFQNNVGKLVSKESFTELEDIFLESLSKAADKYLDDGIISDEERTRYDTFTDTLKLPLGNLPAKYVDSSILKVCQLGFLSDIQKGIRPDVTVNLPIVLGASEYLIWMFNNVTAYEEKTQSQWVGKSNGVSLKICKGVYYRVGQSRGRRVETQYMAPIAYGVLVVTNKNLIFYSTTKSIKVPIKKIIGVVPYGDGLEIQREPNTKRLVFVGFDPWFIMNIFSVLDI